MPMRQQLKQRAAETHATAAGIFLGVILCVVYRDLQIEISALVFMPRILFAIVRFQSSNSELLSSVERILMESFTFNSFNVPLVYFEH